MHTTYKQLKTISIIGPLLTTDHLETLLISIVVRLHTLVQKLGKVQLNNSSSQKRLMRTNFKNKSKSHQRLLELTEIQINHRLFLNPCSQTQTKVLSAIQIWRKKILKTKLSRKNSSLHLWRASKKRERLLEVLQSKIKDPLPILMPHKTESVTGTFLQHQLAKEDHVPWFALYQKKVQAYWPVME